MDALFRLSGAVRRDTTVESWLDNRKSTPLGGLARTWFTRMRGCGDDVMELMHDGYATACVGDAPFAYVGVFKAHVNVGFFQGAALNDPSRLLVGSGKRMRHVKLEPDRPVNAVALGNLIEAAYEDIKARLRTR